MNRIADYVLWSCSQLATISRDPEFAQMLPPPAAEEQALLETALVHDSSRETLIVWACHGRMILLVGYDVFAVLQRHRLPGRVIAKEFATREQARLFLVKDLLRRNLSPLWISYLRGCRSQAEKRPRGGDRKSSQAQAASALGRTAAALAESFAVSLKTLRRDAALAQAVNRLAGLCGQEIKPVLLSRGGPLSREGIMDLARLPDQQAQTLGLTLLLTGKLPRGWRAGPERNTVTLPIEPEAFVRTLERRLGREHCLAVGQVLRRLLCA